LITRVPGVVAVPVRTRIVRQGDDIAALVAAAVHGIAQKGDVIAISETAVAIAQGEFVVAEHIRPSRLAYVLARQAGAMATLSQPESVQLVIDQVGTWRVFSAAAQHAIARVFGKRGRLYELLGDAIAAIDGYTGTMPPYERAIVLAPRDPDSVCETITAVTGVACAVVDANDLEKAKVLGASADVDRALIEHALLDNPHGNSDEQTPIVVLKWR
jgi:F420-0:gamma-glutamyl ligase